MVLIARLVANGLIAGCACGALAVAFALLYRLGGFYQFTLASIYAVAAYAGIPNAGTTLAVAWALLRALAVGAAVAVGLEVVFYTRLRRFGAPPLIPMLASIGIAVIVENLLALSYGPGLRPSLSVGASVIHIGHIVVTKLRVAQAIGCASAGLACVAALQYTPIGLTLRAIASNYELAAVRGINVRAGVVLGSGLAGAVAAVPALFSCWDAGARPQMGNMPLLLAIVAVLVVGARSPVWWFIAGTATGVIQQLAILAFTARWADTTVFLVFSLALLARRWAYGGSRS